MKKFWIIFSIVMTVLIGINAFLFIPNSFAMTTVISQNAEKIINLTENSTIKLNNHDYFDITIESFYEYEDGPSFSPKGSSSITSNLKLIKDDLDYIFLLSGVREDVDFTDDETSIEKTIVYNVYYNKGDLYYNISINDEEPIKQKAEGISTIEAEGFIEDICGCSFNKIFIDFNTLFPADESFDVSSSILLTFNPFIFGQKFKYKQEYENISESYEFYISMFGNLKKQVYKDLREFRSYIKEITYNSFNEFTITEPEGLDEYMLDE